MPRDIWNGELDTSELSKSLDRVANKVGCELVFLPFNQNSNPSDTKVANEIAAEMKTDSEIFNEEVSPSEATSLLRDARVVVGIRLHSVIIAATTKTPFVGVAYRPKCEETLEQLGIENIQWFDDLDAGIVCERTINRWQDGPRQSVKSNVEGLSERASELTETVFATDQSKSRWHLIPLLAVIFISAPFEFYHRFIR